MKKALALALSLLVALSMFSVVSFAASDYVKVTFVNGGEVVKTIEVAADTSITPDLIPAVETEYFTDGEDGARFKHTFKGWKSSVDGKIWHNGTIPAPDGSVASITYTAEYSVEDYSERQSFWNFIESIFERINLLFEYFATIFNF